MPQLAVRQALIADDAALAALDLQTWSPMHTPAARWAADKPFFDDNCRPENVLVAEADGTVAGYVRVEALMPLASASHVQQINGIAVELAWQRRGVAQALLTAAIELAHRRRARKVTLRVLGSNPGAIALYRAAGFCEEGRLRELFLLDGRYVDDVLMSYDLAGS